MSLDITANPMGRGPEQHALADPILSREGWTKQLSKAPSKLNPSLWAFTGIHIQICSSLLGFLADLPQDVQEFESCSQACVFGTVFILRQIRRRAINLKHTGIIYVWTCISVTCCKAGKKKAKCPRNSIISMSQLCRTTSQEITCIYCICTCLQILYWALLKHSAESGLMPSNSNRHFTSTGWPT